MLTTEEIPALIQQYVRAAELAIEAGFDGVEIHGANGYLVDQFINDNVNNQRTDAYGGDAEGRVRLAVEVVKAVADAIGADRTGIRLSPYGTFQGMGDSNPVATWCALLERLNPLGIAFVHLVEPRIAGGWDAAVAPDEEAVNLRPFRQAYKGTLIVAGGLTAESAEAKVKAGEADVAAFGRYFISNPDLPYRIQHDLPFTPYNRPTFYTDGEVGYTDYPTWLEQKQQHAATKA
ncbi:oxo-phytodienoic acid reductase [Zopfochytrium polystomum]|nr:oxo-phytodienoic acid reductase [Zopfochytrium polystomum]